MFKAELVVWLWGTSWDSALPHMRTVETWASLHIDTGRYGSYTIRKGVTILQTLKDQFRLQFYSLIRAFIACLKYHWILYNRIYPQQQTGKALIRAAPSEMCLRHVRIAKALIRLRWCAVWSGPLLSAYRFIGKTWNIWRVIKALGRLHAIHICLRHIFAWCHPDCVDEQAD